MVSIDGINNNKPYFTLAGRFQLDLLSRLPCNFLLSTNSNGAEPKTINHLLQIKDSQRFKGQKNPWTSSRTRKASVSNGK